MTKYILSTLPVFQQNQIRSQYNIPKSCKSIIDISKKYNLKDNEETGKDIKNSIYYNIFIKDGKSQNYELYIKDGKSQNYELYSDKVNSIHFKLDSLKK